MYRVIVKKIFIAKLERLLNYLNVFEFFRFNEIQKKVFFRSTFLLVLFICLSQNLQAQIYDGDLTLSTQTEVDAFNYSEIKGDLIISGPDIIDLSQLSILTAVEGLHLISNTLLINLNGLQNLNAIKGNLILEDNPALENLTGLDNVISVDGYLKILSNNALLNLDKLQGISFIEGSLDIYSNAVLTNLNGLQNVISVGGYLKIRSNGALLSLEKLQNINTIGGSLEIYNNDELVDLDGLQNIKLVDGYLRIASNDKLMNLQGLQNIIAVNGYLEIYNNDAIVDLSGLENITFVEQNLEINGNALLADFCALYSLLNGVGLSGIFDVSSNFMNPTQQQIIDNGSCSSEISSTIINLATPISTGCNSWQVPVNVQNFKNIDAISLKVNFNNSQLTFVGADLNNEIVSAAVYESEGKFSLGYFGDEISLSDGSTLFVLNFTVVPNIDGTPFIINWSTVPGDCEFAGSSGDPLYSSIFNNLNVEIITDELPQIDGPGDLVVNNDEGFCGAVVRYNIPIGTDNCPGAITEQISGLSSGTEFPIGQTTNMFQVTDSQGNIDVCCFTITVNDSEAPVINDCPEDILVYTNNRFTCDQLVTWIPPVANDNCSLLSLTSDYEPGTLFPIGSTTVTYTATDDNVPASISTCNFKINVIDNTPPIIQTCALPQSAIVTDGCSVETPDFVNNDILVSDNCGTVNITQNPMAGEWLSFTDTPYDITITATDEAGNVTTCVTTFTVLKSTIAGTLLYHNSNQSPLNNVTLNLIPGDQTCITDENGMFLFTDLCAQTYTIKVIENEKLVGYINSTDASAVNKWGTEGESLEYVCFLAGDVTNDLFINSTDALSIQNNFVYGTALERSKWSYWKKGSIINNNTDPFLTPDQHPDFISVEVKGSEVSGFDLYGLCTGDFNGSFTPLKSAGNSLSLMSENKLQINENCEFDISLRSGFSMEVGAVSLIIDLPTEFVEVKDVSVNKSEVPVSWLFQENELRIGWNSVTPIIVAANENLITLKLKTSPSFKFGQKFNLRLKNNPLNEIADGNANVIHGVNLLSPIIENSFSAISVENKSDVLEIKNYPNPFRGTTDFEYYVPFEGKVNIEIYNHLGQVVLNIQNIYQKPGNYFVKDIGAELKPGLYIANLHLSDYKSNVICNSKIKLIKHE